MDTLAGSLSCDSILEMNLAVSPTFSNLNFQS